MIRLISEQIRKVYGQQLDGVGQEIQIVLMEIVQVLLLITGIFVPHEGNFSELLYLLSFLLNPVLRLRVLAFEKGILFLLRAW